MIGIQPGNGSQLEGRYLHRAVVADNPWVNLYQLDAANDQLSVIGLNGQNVFQPERNAQWTLVDKRGAKTLFPERGKACFIKFADMPLLTIPKELDQVKDEVEFKKKRHSR